MCRGWTGFGFRAHFIEMSQTIRPSVLNRFGLRVDIVEIPETSTVTGTLMPVCVGQVTPVCVGRGFSDDRGEQRFGSSSVSLRVGD